MKRWEYQILEVPLGEKYEQEMWFNEQGNEGWELCSVVNGVNGVFCFLKREIS